MSAETPTIFENTTQGWVGAIKIRRNGDRDSVVVAPGERVELTEEEQMLTANAPRDPDNSPFVEKPYQDFDEAGEVINEGVRPALREVKAEDRPIPAKQQKAPPAPEGKRDEKEIVGA